MSPRSIWSSQQHNKISSTTLLSVWRLFFVLKQDKKLLILINVLYLRPKRKETNSKTLGRRMAVGIERKRFMQVTQMWPFSSPSPTDDKLQVWRNRLFGYKKPSIMISVIISSWPRPYSNQVINTHIILLKEIWKCIPDCQRKEFPVIYTTMFLELFFFFHSSIFKKY